MRIVTVVICDASGAECLYTDGKRWKSVGETTVYACDIAAAAGGEPIVFTHRHVDMIALGGEDFEWPLRLEDIPWPENTMPARLAEHHAGVLADPQPIGPIPAWVRGGWKAPITPI